MKALCILACVVLISVAIEHGGGRVKWSPNKRSALIPFYTKPNRLEKPSDHIPKVCKVLHHKCYPCSSSHLAKCGWSTRKFEAWHFIEELGSCYLIPKSEPQPNCASGFAKKNDCMNMCLRREAADREKNRMIRRHNHTGNCPTPKSKCFPSLAVMDRWVFEFPYSTNCTLYLKGTRRPGCGFGFESQEVCEQSCLHHENKVVYRSELVDPVIQYVMNNTQGECPHDLSKCGWSKSRNSLWYYSGLFRTCHLYEAQTLHPTCGIAFETKAECLGRCRNIANNRRIITRVQSVNVTFELV